MILAVSADVLSTGQKPRSNLSRSYAVTRILNIAAV